MEIDRTRKVKGRTLITLHGKLDHDSAQEILSVLDRLIKSGEYHLVIDMHDIDFLHSMVAKTLLGALAEVRAKGGSLTLVGSREHLRHWLKGQERQNPFDIKEEIDEIDEITESGESATEVTPTLGSVHQNEDEVAVRVYLSQGNDPYGVEDALRHLLDAFGMDVRHEEPPVWGSWFHVLIAFARDGLAQQRSARIANGVAKYRHASAVDANEAAQIEAVAGLIAALDKESDAVIQIGATILVKVADDIFCRSVPPEEFVYWEQNPHVFKDPELALRMLRQHPESLTYILQHSLCDCGSGVPANQCTHGLS